ncbi:MAG: hypothetical protein ABNH27_02950 [Alcanivorax sp.]|jgi:hypothetical protein|uniref:ORC-CDC6 family AAA ATPase n=1 Tax=Alcanivorax sp. TaxID=1872427 RepID=UPI0032D93008
MPALERYKSIFEIDNARNETPETLSKTFVWTHNFERIITAKNHIILGSRGSGKTAFVKMLSHSYLSRCDDEKAKEVIKKKSLIGTYIPMRIEWVGGLKNKSWLTTEEQLALFEWRLNLASCLSFISTIRSCLISYIPESKKRIDTEIEISKEISKTLLNEEFLTLVLLERELERIEFEKQTEIFSSGIHEEKMGPEIGRAFHTALFSPAKRMISILKQHLKFPSDTAWIIALDEAEFLSESQQKSLNNHLRSDAGQIFYKITTMPYCHYTLDTFTQAPIVHREDFDYIYIDTAFSKYDKTSFHLTGDFIEKLICRRLKEALKTDSTPTLSSLLSNSLLLGESEESRQSYEQSQKKVLELVEKHCNDATLKRAKELFGTKSFDDQIKRKLTGTLLLKDSVSTLKGNQRSELYSGREMFIRCSDGNPRRAFSILNNMLIEYPQAISDSGFKPIPRKIQNRVYERHAKVYLNRLKHSGNSQLSVFDVINIIGNVFQLKIHREKVGTDFYGSIEVSDIDESVWQLIVSAVGLGALFPITNASQPDELPFKNGIFRLSYAFAAYFQVLPRKGKAMSLNTIMNDRYARSMLDKSAQAGLFDE